MSSNSNNNKDLSDIDRLFLNCLFNADVNPTFDPEVARQLAGYTDESLQSIIRRLKAEYQNEVQNYFLSLSSFAAGKLKELSSGSIVSVNADKVHKAATEILDRAGISKKDKQEIEFTSTDGVLILPALQSREE